MRLVVSADRRSPVGFGQIRRPAQLPVLTMVTGYSRWLSAMLLPSRRAEDLFAGWWQLIESAGCGAADAGLGWRGRDRAVAVWAGRAHRGVSGVPRDAGHQSGGAANPADPSEGHDRTLSRLFGAVVSAGSGLRLTGGLQQPDAAMDFGGQRPAAPGVGVRPADRIAADRHAMLALPPVAPAMGWRDWRHDWHVIITSAWTAMTTRCIRR